MAYSDLFNFGPVVAPEPEADEGAGGSWQVADNSPTPAMPRNLAGAIKATAEKIGVDPVDLATAISYETAGTFDKWKAGPRTQWGQHRGLIQWGEPQAKQYGVSQDSSDDEQMEAVGRYLQDRGLKKGANLLDIYSTINAGAPGLYDRSDANNGGAPGTVRDKVEQQMADHRLKARALLGQTATSVEDYLAHPEKGYLAPTGNGEAKPVPASQKIAPMDDAALGQALQEVAQPVEPISEPVAQPNPQPLNERIEQNTSQQIPEPTPIQPSGLTNFIGEVVNQVKQGGRGLAESAITTPWNLASAVVAPVALLGRKMGVEAPAKAVEFMQKESNAGKELAGLLTGTQGEEPKTPGQNLARTLGRSAVPGSLPMTAAMTGADLMSQAITPSPAMADAPLDKPTAEKLLFPNQVTTANLPGPRVSHTINTAGGPAKVSDGDLSILGIMGAVTLGAVFAPSILSKIRSNPLPKFRPVEDAAQGTMAMSNRVDLARTYDDVNAGLLRIARRAGIDPLTLQNVSDKFQIQTSGAARNLVNSAISNGRMETPNFTFKVQAPLAEIAKANSEPVRDYLHARDTFDDILQKEADLAKRSARVQAAQAALGPITVRGMTKADALSVVNALEQAHPEVVEIGKAYRANVKEMRAFLGKGEYSTLTKKEQQLLQQTSQNYVPWKSDIGEKTRVLDADVDRANPFDALKDEMMKSLRARMENEAKGQYIDAMRKVQPQSFVRVSSEQLKNNPHWEKNKVTMYRRGKPEHYTTDPFIADVLNIDPYAINGVLAQGLYATKRLAESGATGRLAPWFAATSALRSWQIGKMTAGEGLKPPTALGMAKSIPQQLYPQVAKAITTSLDNGSGGWLGNVLGPQTMQALSQRLTKAYDDSFYAKLEHAGTHEGSFLQHQAQLSSGISAALAAAKGPAAGFLNGYKALLNATHNAASFDFAKKNAGAMPLPKLAMEARHLTGDPMVGGQFFRDGRKPIRFEMGDSVSHTLATRGVQAYGASTEIGREFIPWWNITTQGMKRIGESYVNNPARFVGKTYLYQALPAAALFMYSRGLGVDPNGKSYTDYQMNGRSEYAKLMNWYIPVPGRPAENGIEVPRFHELAPVAHMMEVGLDHLVRSDAFQGSEDFMRSALALVGAKDYFPSNNGGALFSPWEDTKTAGGAFTEAAVVPPTPPVANALLATQGMVMPQGMFGGGDAYKKKTDPYDQLGGMNATVELVARSLATGIADIVGAGYAAYTQTPEGVGKGITNALSEGSKRAVMKTPIVRDLMDVKPPMSGNTRITEELFKKEKVIGNLSRFYRTWTRDGGQINTKLASAGGTKVVENLLGGAPSTQPAGLSQPMPTNPLYAMFMTEVYNKFNKDSPTKKVDPVTGQKSSKGNAIEVPDDEGGIGAKSMWRRYGDYTENLKRLRSINDGNNVTWQMQLAQRPDELKYLKENNVDHKDLRSVRNFYEGKRQEVARQILFSIRAVEEDFSRRLGKPFHIEDLDPYARSAKEGTELELQPIIPPWADGSGSGLQ